MGKVTAQREYAVTGGLARARTAVTLRVEAVAHGSPPPDVVVLLEGGLWDHRAFAENPGMELGSRYWMLTGTRIGGPVPRGVVPAPATRRNDVLSQLRGWYTSELIEDVRQLDRE